MILLWHRKIEAFCFQTAVHLANSRVGLSCLKLIYIFGVFPWMSNLNLTIIIWLILLFILFLHCVKIWFEFNHPSRKRLNFHVQSILYTIIFAPLLSVYKHFQGKQTIKQTKKRIGAITILVRRPPPLISNFGNAFQTEYFFILYLMEDDAACYCHQLWTWRLLQFVAATIE